MHGRQEHDANSGPVQQPTMITLISLNHFYGDNLSDHDAEMLEEVNPLSTFHGPRQCRVCSIISVNGPRRVRNYGGHSLSCTWHRTVFREQRLLHPK